MCVCVCVCGKGGEGEEREREGVSDRSNLPVYDFRKKEYK